MHDDVNLKLNREQCIYQPNRPSSSPRDILNKHSDACIYLPPYKLDVLKMLEYKFSCEMEAHVEVTTSLMFDCNTFKDKRHLLILVAITQLSKELQLYNFIM